MPKILVIAPGTPAPLEGRSLAFPGVTADILADPEVAVAQTAERVYDLLVLAEMAVDRQQELAARIQASRRWRLVPVLYVSDGETPGLAIPASFRPEMDGLATGKLDSPQVLRRMVDLAHDGVANVELIVAGTYELDPIRGLLRFPGHEFQVTERESEILAILLGQPNRTVPASEIIERGWGASSDDRYLQILRRHVSNIRRKLEETPAARAVRTVRGSGYRFDTRSA